MKHRYPEVAQCYRYQIGDWVLQAGEPYQWQSDDYYRGIRGMQGIKPMPMSMEVLMALGMQKGSARVDEGIICTGYKFSKKDELCGTDIIHVAIFKYDYTDGRDTRYVLTAGHNYDSHDHRFNGKINNVHELQSALRSVQLYDIAESIDIKQAETHEQD